MTNSNHEYDTTADNWSIYTGAASLYQASRPTYPTGAVEWIVSAIPDHTAPLVAVDVGCGTGIFTRRLASHLKRTDRVIGVEPNDDMRRQAQQASGAMETIEFASGSSSEIPIPDGRAALVSAASAAHWFDLPTFYNEVCRVLMPSGIIAIVQNKRRFWDSSFLAEYERFHERYVTGYRRGTFPNRHGGFSPELFQQDLADHPQFKDVRTERWSWSRRMKTDEFKSFSLSTSHTRRALTSNNAIDVMRDLDELIMCHADSTGTLEIPYVTDVVIARYAGH